MANGALLGGEAKLKLEGSGKVLLVAVAAAVHYLCYGVALPQQSDQKFSDPDHSAETAPTRVLRTQPQAGCRGSVLKLKDNALCYSAPEATIFRALAELTSKA